MYIMNKDTFINILFCDGCGRKIEWTGYVFVRENTATFYHW